MRVRACDAECQKTVLLMSHHFSMQFSRNSAVDYKHMYLLSYSVFVFVFSSSLLFSVPVPCARLSWPSRQLVSARKSTVPYRIASYRILSTIMES